MGTHTQTHAHAHTFFPAMHKTDGNHNMELRSSGGLRNATHQHGSCYPVTQDENTGETEKRAEPGRQRQRQRESNRLCPEVVRWRHTPEWRAGSNILLSTFNRTDSSYQMGRFNLPAPCESRKVYEIQSYGFLGFFSNLSALFTPTGWVRIKSTLLINTVTISLHHTLLNNSRTSSRATVGACAWCMNR